LCCGAAARQIDHLGAGEFGAVDPGPFDAAHPLDHERGDRYKSDNDQPGADAEKRLAAAQWRERHRRQCLQQCLGRLSVNVRHARSPAPVSQGDGQV
jgi:hypothetical protein